MIAPFLSYDRDPYLVITPEGRLSWIWDAYTITENYPYSQPVSSGAFNYIRNSVKVVIDAYQGTASFYVADPADPLIRSYQRIFPGMFRPLAEMPEGLKSHLRYPEDLFRVQAGIYTTYHMRDPQTFYNREDKWVVAREQRNSGGLPGLGDQTDEGMEPYYVIMRLPGEPAAEFILILPFTPSTRQNMIAWIGARCDGAHYGELVVFKFPKQALVVGPMQVEAFINQDPKISSERTLWGQQGSQVIWGNLLVIPVGDSLLYVKPLYLQAEASQIPEMKRVIVSSGTEVKMAETFEGAVSALLGIRQVEVSPGAPPAAPAAPAPAAAPAPPVPSSVSELARSAWQHYQAAQQRASAGDWAGYGQELKLMEQALNQLRKGAGR